MFRLLNDHVLLKVLESPTRDDITIPNPISCRESYTSCEDGVKTSLRPNLTAFGEVVAVGPGGRIDAERRVKPDVRVGDQVILREPYANGRIEVLVAGVRHWVICAHEIAAVVMSPQTA